MPMCVSQALPAPIVEPIIRYTRQLGSCAPLLYLCRSWRYQTILLLAKTLHLGYNSSVGAFVVKESQILAMQNIPVSQYRHLVKKVVFEVPHSGFPGIQVESSFGTAPSRLPVFESAKSVHVHIYNTEGSVSLSAMDKIDKKARVLTRCMRSLVPGAINLSFNMEIELSRYSTLYPSSILNEVEQEFGMQAHLQSLVCSSLQLPTLPTADAVRELTYLRLALDQNYDSAASLLETCASTLAELDIDFVNEAIAAVNRLVETKEACPIVYSRLKKLTTNVYFTRFLDDVDTLDDFQKPNISAGEPFPQLEYLNVRTKYMFGNDIVFRGNQSSLLEVHLPMDDPVLIGLYKHGKHLQAHTSNLKRIYLKNADYTGLPSLMGFVTHISGSAHTLKLCTSKFTASFDPLLLKPDSFGKLQTLDLPNPLTLTNIMNLIKSLPLLIDLECAFTRVGPEFSSMDDTQAVDYTFKTYYPLNTSICRWRASTTSRASVQHLPTFALVLAVACPKLTHFTVSQRLTPEFRAAMKLALKELQPCSYANIKTLSNIYTDSGVQ